MNQKFNRIRQILVVLVLFAAVEGFSSCEKYSFLPRPVDPNTTWLYAADIQPIFNTNCVSCHGGAQAPDLRDGKSYAALKKMRLITPPGETSGLYGQLNSSSHAAKTTSTEKQKILYWITQGALNNLK
jgi:mono/diheme cytochrome c family protein